MFRNLQGEKLHVRFHMFGFHSTNSLFTAKNDDDKNNTWLLLLVALFEYWFTVSKLLRQGTKCSLCLRINACMGGNRIVRSVPSKSALIFYLNSQLKKSQGHMKRFSVYLSLILSESTPSTLPHSHPALLSTVNHYPHHQSHRHHNNTHISIRSHFQSEHQTT